MKDGVATRDLSVATAEQGPQFALYLPAGLMATSRGPIEAAVQPLAPTDQPAGARIDGNVYSVALTAPEPVTLTGPTQIAAVYLRATTARQPPPAIRCRAAASVAWERLVTRRTGVDIYSSTFPGPGQFTVAFELKPDKAGGRPPALPFALGGVLTLVVLVVILVRVRAQATDAANSP
ncbi:MAG: hypothetical protein ABR549_17245 [Mycobacteriales bacterium]